MRSRQVHGRYDTRVRGRHTRVLCTHTAADKVICSEVRVVSKAVVLGDVFFSQSTPPRLVEQVACLDARDAGTPLTKLFVPSYVLSQKQLSVKLDSM